MKLLIVWICFFVTVSSLAQSDEKYPKQFSDSSYRYQGVVPPVEYKYHINEFYIVPLFNQIPDVILFDKNSSTVWLRTELLLSNHNLLTEIGEVNTHFTSPLYQQYLKDPEFDMVRYVLGTVQAGAVAYMAYRHIKKYGFWK